MQAALANNPQNSQETALTSILNYLASQNSNLIGTIGYFEDLGNRLKSTPNQLTAEKNDVGKPDGLLDEIKMQLEYYTQHNAKLESIYKKFQSLL